MGCIQIPFFFFFFFIIISISLLLGLGSCEDEAALQTKCSPDVTSLMTCLDYATAKSDSPSSDCCSSVSSRSTKDPECLCFIIQQASKGGSSVQSLGLDIDRLKQLPQACKMNTTISQCPKLLDLSPSSTDNAIFANTTTKATSPSTPATTANTKSEGVMQQVHRGCTFTMAVVSAVFLFIFSIEA